MKKGSAKSWNEVLKTLEERGLTKILDFSKFTYKGWDTKSTVVCKKCGKENQKSIAYLKYTCSRGGHPCKCYYLKESKRETFIKEILTSLKIPFDKEKSFPTCKNKASLRFDFYIINSNLLIEYQGLQHFQATQFFDKQLSKEEQFEQITKRDQIKKEWAQKNGYKILYLDCYQTPRKLYKTLISFLKENNIQPCINEKEVEEITHRYKTKLSRELKDRINKKAREEWKNNPEKKEKMREWSRKYRKENLEREREKGKLWLREKMKDPEYSNKVKTYQKEYLEKLSKEKKSEYAKKYYEKKKQDPAWIKKIRERNRENVKKYRKQNPEHYLEKGRREREKQKQDPTWSERSRQYAKAYRERKKLKELQAKETT